MTLFPTASLQRRPPLIDELLHVGSGRGARRAPMMSDHVPHNPLPAPHVISLKPAQGKLCRLGARGRRGVKSLSSSLETCATVSCSSTLSSRSLTSASALSSCSSRSSMRRRWCERSASSSASSRGLLLRGRCAIRADARSGASLPTHAAGFSRSHSRSHACAQRKALEDVIIA